MHRIEILCLISRSYLLSCSSDPSSMVGQRIHSLRSYLTDNDFLACPSWHSRTAPHFAIEFLYPTLYSKSRLASSRVPYFALSVWLSAKARIGILGIILGQPHEQPHSHDNEDEDDDDDDDSFTTVLMDFIISGMQFS